MFYDHRIGGAFGRSAAGMAHLSGFDQSGKLYSALNAPASPTSTHGML
jgi:hypothetical protein